MVRIKSSQPLRGEIYWVNLDPTIGSEIQKTRPCLIFSINAYNKEMSRVIIIPITSNVEDVQPFHVVLDVNGKKGKLITDQIRCIDKKRLRGRMDTISLGKISEVEAAIKLCLGLT